MPPANPPSSTPCRVPMNGVHATRRTATSASRARSRTPRTTQKTAGPNRIVHCSPCGDPHRHEPRSARSHAQLVLCRRHGTEVVIYKGVPGGVLAWKPTVDQHTGVPLSALSAVDHDHVLSDRTRGSLTTPRAFVARLQDSVAVAVAAAKTTIAAPTTTKPRTTTTIKVPKYAILATIPVGADPLAAAYGDGVVWVACDTSL